MRRIVGRGIDGREIGRGARQHVGEAGGAVGGAVDRKHEVSSGSLVADLVELGEPGALVMQRLGAGILQPVDSASRPNRIASGSATAPSL